MAIEQSRGASVAAPDLDVDGLRARLRGPVIRPGDSEYDAARAVYNGMIDKRPALIARCVDVADVIASVNFGRETGLTVAIRGGGHHGAGLGMCDDGLVIDLSLIKGVRVDPVSRTARVGAGCTLADLDHATHAFGLATPSGIFGSTGVSGLTLGGGLGHLTRAYGLSIDNVLSVDMVLADGSFVTADADNNSDLFWAVRGGGGNFGVVTSFVFRLHPLSTVVTGPTLWHVDRAADALQWYRDFLPQAPEELNGFFAFLSVPPAEPFPEKLHGKTMCGVWWCCTSTQDAPRLLDPVRRLFGGPALDMVGELPYPVLQSAFDQLYPPHMQWYWRADFVKTIPDAAVERHVEYGSALPSELSAMHLYPIDGAAARVGPHDTAFSYRDARWASVIAGIDPEPANAARIRDWSKAYWDALHPYSAGGAYVNMMMDEGIDRVRAAYRDNYPRLVAIKRRFDPANLFNVNQNIPPGDSTSATEAVS
jgi:FAD/FMN-containing dehydrogenase